MEKSKVYFTDFRARTGEGLPAKLKRLMKKAGFASMDMEGKFVAIKCILASWEISAICGPITPRRWQTW